MSESETKDDPEGTPAPPDEPAEAPAEPEQTPEQKPEEDRRLLRRLNRVTSTLAQTARERDELAQRLGQVERMQQAAAGQQAPSPELQQYIHAEAQKIAEAQRFEDRRAALHAAGNAAYDDWDQRCRNLEAMGAIPIANLAIEMPNAARLLGELHDNPDELERIASIQSERGRAIALGQFAAKLEARPTRAVSRAPRPPSPVDGRTSPKFNEYSPSLSAQDLVQRYREQEMEKRRQG